MCGSLFCLYLAYKDTGNIKHFDADGFMLFHCLRVSGSNVQTNVGMFQQSQGSKNCANMDVNNADFKIFNNMAFQMFEEGNAFTMFVRLQGYT